MSAISNETIIDLATGLLDGHIITSDMVIEHSGTSLLPLVFMPLMFDDNPPQPKDGKSIVFLGDKRKHRTSPAGVDGWPMFMEFQVLVDDDVHRLNKALAAMRSVRQQEQTAAQEALR
ncbi:hypothetical protein [Ferrimonas marina]|uniref:Uncharacterized protein n=1 Tax=Ferrimonas marina TaxID=299255 RepID=A0A1M5TMJ6_9GAMM|nr:hypothetical protein [Ferrimonas marina]SHH52035.1 hypothetical protein SAMN02745129_2208 [Ferrimonas marina]